MNMIELEQFFPNGMQQYIVGGLLTGIALLITSFGS